MEGMGALEIPQPKERITNLLVVCLPTDGLITGFQAGQWTIVERFEQLGDAKVRLHRLLKPLTHLKARAFIVQETDPRRPNKPVSWRTLVRFNEPELYLDPSDAVEASETALESWATAATSFSAPRVVEAKPAAPNRALIVAVAALAASVVAVIGMFVALQAPRFGVQIDPLSEFTRRGGVALTVPDEHRPGWYVRVKMYPDKSVEIVDRFPDYMLDARRQAGDLKPEDVAAILNRPRAGAGASKGNPTSMPALQEAAAAFWQQ
jgi:hypothetical protein